MQLTRDQRRELTSELADMGMSTRAIAPIVGVHYDTVASDIRAVGNPTGAEPRQITGRDGKTYSAPSPNEPRAVNEKSRSTVTQLASSRQPRDGRERSPRVPGRQGWVACEDNRGHVAIAGHRGHYAHSHLR